MKHKTINLKEIAKNDFRLDAKHYLDDDAKNERKSEFGEVVYSVTAKELEADGYFTNVTEYAKKLGFRIAVRITPNIVNILNGGKEEEYISWDAWHDKLDSLLEMTKDECINAKDDSFVQYEFEGHKVWAMSDYTNGTALHIFTPSEY